MWGTNVCIAQVNKYLVASELENIQNGVLTYTIHRMF